MKMLVDSEDQTREYMISQAKACLSNGDSCYAKSWIMTANALFPQNDKIKMESYEMSKCEGNVDEAVKYLCEMFDSNQCQQQLNKEFNKIVISCRNEWQTYHLTDQQIHAVFGSQDTSSTVNTVNQFYIRLFGSLSPQYQYKLLRRVADRTEDRLVLIDLLLLILKRFPESIVENGLKLIEIMDENCVRTDSVQTDSALNLSQYLKKKLVFNVLPLIFSNSSRLVLDFKTVQKLMERTLKYFVERVISQQTVDNEDNGESVNQKSTGSKETDESVEQKVKQIFQLIGNKNNWKLFSNIDFVNEKHLDLIYDKISNFLNEFLFSGDTDSPIDLSSASTAKIKVDDQSNQQILYATLLLFLHCLRIYSKLISDYVLIEESNHTMNESKIAISLNKKRKLAEPLITNNTELRQIFIIASKAHKLLQENLTINSEFSRVSELIGLKNSQTYHWFIIDSNLFKGDYNEVISLIVKQNTISIKSKLQLISSAVMLHDYSATLKHCLDSVECLPLLKNTSLTSNKDSSDNRSAIPESFISRHLTFLSLTVDDIISYIIGVIILCLKERVLFSLKPSDTGVGHLLVLSQYKWPNNLKLFLTCISFIKSGSNKVHGSQSLPKFIYQNFFSYVFIPDIIEEFMSIVESGNILLELKPSTSTLGTPLKTSTKMMTTRGVNKGFKEENRSALIQQMKNSKTLIQNQLFIEFINKEIRSFLTSIQK